MVYAGESTPVCYLCTAEEDKDEIHNRWKKYSNQNPHYFSFLLNAYLTERITHPTKEECYGERNACDNVDIFGYPKSPPTPKPEVENTCNEDENAMNQMEFFE
jgi:hypothetical protein